MSTSIVPHYQHYHDLLAQPALAEESAAVLEQRSGSRDCFGDRALCSAAAEFLTLEEYRLICRACGLVGSAFDKVRAAPWPTRRCARSSG